MSDVRLFSVNWVDGMLVTQQHLKDQEKYFEELTRWYALQSGDRYGLTKKSSSGKPALSMNLVKNGNRLRVEVSRCQAITPDGFIIEINESNQSAPAAELETGASSVAVYLGVNPTEKKQVGEPDPQEDIPRIPYLTGNYVLTLGQPPALPEGQYLKIAEVTLADGEPRLSERYFPPCVTVNAEERLAQKTAEFRNRLENLLSLSSRAYAAMASGGVLKGEQTGLQTAFRNTIFQMAAYLSSTLDDFRIGKNAFHPLDMVLYFKKLFRIFTTLLNLNPGLKDFLNERFFVKQMNSDVGRFVAEVESFLLADYDHTELGKHVHAIDGILANIREVLGFLAQVKRDQLGEQAVATDTLTYRGQTYRVVDYKESRVEQVGELSYLVISVAEPRAMSDTVILLSKDLFTAGEWTNMQVRLGLNEARGLGETDPVEVDTVTFGNKVALHPQDMLKSPSVYQVTLIFRGAQEGARKFADLGKMDLIVYAL